MSHRWRSGVRGARPGRRPGRLGRPEVEELEDRTLRGIVGLHARADAAGHVSVRFDRGGPNAWMLGRFVATPDQERTFEPLGA